VSLEEFELEIVHSLAWKKEYVRRLVARKALKG